MAPKPPPVPSFAHSIAKGESLADVARAYNCTIARLRQANQALLAGVKDDAPIDRVKVRALAVPRVDRGTKVLPGLQTEQTHELEVPHRLAVLYAADRSDLTGLFDVVRPDGEVVRDVLYARFDIRYVVPGGVEKVAWAAGIVASSENPLENFKKRAGYCAAKDFDVHELKKFAGGGGGGGGGGSGAAKGDLEGEFKRTGAIFLGSGELAVEPGRLAHRAVRIAIAEEDARADEDASGATVVVPWKTVDLKDLDPKKRYRIYVLASNGKTAVDGAGSGDIHLLRVTLDVEIPEVLPGIPKEADARFEVRIAPFELSAPEEVRRLEDPAIHYCTDSVPLRRPGNYKEKLEPFLDKAFVKQEEYRHEARKVLNDAADHRAFQVTKEARRIDVPANELLLLAPLAKGLLDQVVKDDKPQEAYDLKLIAGLAPLAADLARVRIFTRTMDPKANVERAEVDGAARDLEAKEKALEAAEKEARAARAEKLAGDAAERARLFPLHARRAALEKKLRAAGERASRPDPAPPVGPQGVNEGGRRSGGPSSTTGDDPQVEGADHEGARFERDRLREELRALFADHRADLAEAEKLAAGGGPGPAAATPGPAAAPAARKDPSADRPARAAEALARAREDRTAAEKRLLDLAKVQVRELVPFGAAGDRFEAVAHRVEAGATSVVVLFADGHERIASARVDTEEVIHRGEKEVRGATGPSGKPPRLRRIAETSDATFVPPPPPPGSEARFERIEKRVVRPRWTGHDGDARRHARPDEVVCMTADLEGFAPGLEARFRVYEKDESSPDDFIEEVKAKTGAGEVTAEWKVRFVDDQDDAKAGKDGPREFEEPEFYFVVKVEDQDEKEAAKKEARSGLLRYQDWIEVEAHDDDGRPHAGWVLVVKVKERELRAVLDAYGRARLEHLPPGPCEMRLLPPERPARPAP